MVNRKSLVSGAAAAALVSVLGLAFAQTSSDSPALPDSALPDSSIQSDMRPASGYALPDNGNTYSADSAAPAQIEAIEVESDAEPAPQADRN